MTFHAVLVGIDRYRDDAIPELRCAKADARALAELIEHRIAPDERNVRLLLDEQATQRNIVAAISDDLHRCVEEDDVILLYFAGHGSPERMGARDKRSRYLLPHDTEYARIHTSALDLDRHVEDWFRRIGYAKLIVLIIDACFSGAAGGRSVMGPRLAATPSLPNYLGLADPAPISIKRLDLGRGRVLLCAADDNQLALEDRPSGHGIFTRYLLESLTRTRAGSTTVLLTELYNEVSQAVRQATAGAQEPVVSLVRGAHASLPSFAA